mmetsp:Transcript_1215/g.1258  ORF Transcript_1215/g.1258 Transcript_1215/m.1258 type:complete len:136 (-) Transcript_1215:379-786(-)
MFQEQLKSSEDKVYSQSQINTMENIFEREKKELQNNIYQQEMNAQKLQYELELVKNELKEVRESNKSLDGNKFSYEKTITEHLLNNQALKREIDEKEKVVVQLGSLIETNKTQIQNTEETLAIIKDQNKKMESKL